MQSNYEQYKFLFENKCDVEEKVVNGGRKRAEVGGWEKIVRHEKLKKLLNQLKIN